MNYFKNKTVWVTGASSGIGEAVAYELSNLQTRLVLSSIDGPGLKKVREKCEQRGSNCLDVPFDLSDSEQVKNAVDKVVKEFGPIDMLFNIGGLSQRSTILETPLEIDRKIMEINYFGPIYLTKLVLPSMVQNGGGHVVVVSSIAGKFGFPLRSAYSSAKHALYGFFETLRAEMYKEKINVTMICPGRVQTNISLNALTKEGKPHGQLDQGQANGIPVQKCAKQMLKAVKNNKKDVLIGGKELLMVYLKKFAPFVFYKIITKINPT